ncbi:MSHA biogenesis protein MshN [Alteromonas sp. KUL17]|uniref:tetratricopeptide repeat protein n=1 Tax=Alteromonas sp. KUL17 TaxID=2480796 RepID=UPI0010378198|nr:tetratricopeptide repeat protein [Alteromonas sp. KUL17]TAP25342.1 tetratricopeptide repeat protein [Alteromonas sp. KUL17]GEA03616.1 MSHA biogenesis protein MshN [Alteromonas sp. KUL17]
MSILNDTLKTLDERDKSEDFGLPPTVEVSQRPVWPKALMIIAVLVFVVWLVITLLSGTSHREKNEDGLSTTAVSSAPSVNNPPAESTISERVADSTADINAPSQGMQSTPLSESDMALQNRASDVAELVFNTVDESLEDDEAQYRKRVTTTASAISTADDVNASSVNNSANASSPQSELSAASSKAAEPKPTNIITREPVVEVAPKSPEQQSAVHLEAGLKAYNFGIFDEAQKSFTLALATFPHNDEARKQLAALYFGQNNNLQALQVLSEGIVISPSELIWRELMAKILVQESRFEEVLNLMPDSLDAKALAEGRADYLILKGTSAQTINKSDQAISAFSAMTSLQPNNAKWWLALGVNYDALADERLAISSYSRALAIGGLSSASAQYANSRLTDLQEQP